MLFDHYLHKKAAFSLRSEFPFWCVLDISHSISISAAIDGKSRSSELCGHSRGFWLRQIGQEARCCYDSGDNLVATVPIYDEIPPRAPHESKVPSQNPRILHRSRPWARILLLRRNSGWISDNSRLCQFVPCAIREGRLELRSVKGRPKESSHLAMQQKDDEIYLGQRARGARWNKRKHSFQGKPLYGDKVRPYLIWFFFFLILNFVESDPGLFIW